MIRKAKESDFHRDLEFLEKTLLPYFESRPEVALGYVFGSILGSVKDTVHDIDIAILAQPGFLEMRDRELPYGYGAFLTTQIGHLLRYDMVDVSVLNYAPPLLLRRVIGSGKLIYFVSEEVRVRFETTSLRKHADTEHIRKIKRHYMRKRIEKGITAYG